MESNKLKEKTTIYDLPKDIYLYTAELQEDKDVVNMLTVNKTFNDPIFFQRIFQKRYPYLVQYKKARESWREFYLRMIYYLAYLKEYLNISYINVPNFDPIFLYKNSKEDPDFSLNYILAHYIGRTGNKQMIDSFINEMMGKNIGTSVIRQLYEGIVESGNLDLFKHYEKMNLSSIYQSYMHLFLIENAVVSTNIDILNYILEKAKKKPKKILYYLMTGYARIGNIEMFKKYEGQLKLLINQNMMNDYMVDIFDSAIQGRHLNMIKFLVEERNISINSISQELIYLIQIGHTDNDLDIIKYLISKLSDITLKETLNDVNEFRKFIDKDILQYLDSLV